MVSILIIIYIYLLKKKNISWIYYKELNNNISENKKRYFLNLVLNYGLDKEYYLCFKHFKDENKLDLRNWRNDNSHLKKLVNEYELFRIPTVNNVIDLIEKNS